MHYINCGDRASWLETRRRFIGASDSAAILGCGYANQSAVTIWEDKVYGRVSDDTPKRLRVGTLIQPALVAIAEMETGLGCHAEAELSIAVHDEIPWLSASLDAWITDEEFGTVPLELKNVSNFARHEWEDEPPLKFQIQLQHQLAVTGAKCGWLFGLLSGDEPVARRILRNDTFILALIAKLTEFWSYVENKTLPPLDGSVPTEQVLSRLYPGDTGATVQLPVMAAEWHEQLVQAKSDVKSAEERKTAAENELKAAIGGATIGELPGVCRYSWKQQSRKAHYVEESTFRVLRLTK